MQSIPFMLLFLCSTITLRAQDIQQHKLGIEEMFRLAEQNSRSIRVYDIAEQEAEQAVKIARNAKYPSIDASLSASYLGDGWLSDRNFSKGENAPMPHLGNNFAIEATQILYAGGVLSNNVKITKLYQQLAQLDKEKNRQDIRFLLVGNYLELYKQRNQSEVYIKNIEQTQRLLADIKAKQKEGLALKNDITRYELQLQSLELALTQIENGKIILNNQLITVLGLPQTTVIDIDTTLISQIPLRSPENQWQNKAIVTSPLFKQAQIGVTQSKYREKIAKAEQLPTLALFAGDHFDGPIIIEVPPINKNFNYWYAGIGLKFNIASVYKTRKNIRLSKLSTQKAEENEQLLQENIRTEIKVAYVRFIESFTTFETQIKSLELATQNYDVIRNRYLNELALITDMLDASNSKLNAELQVANARLNILFHYYKLKKITGIL